MEKKFKPFQKVIIKSLIDEYWSCDLYSHLVKDTGLHETINRTGLKDNDILPYEGNEELVGTTDKPEQEIRLEKGEWIFVADEIKYFLDSRFSIRIFKEITNNVFVTNAYNYQYAIRFSDFNPNDMEETSRHILCVKNGKIIRYKNN